MRNLFWVGPRQSDIRHLSGLFDGAVTIFGNHDGDRQFSFEGTYGWRPDHNAARNRPAITAFYIARLSELAAKGVRFFCYGNEWQNCGDPTAALFRNDLTLINRISNKMSMRLLFSDRMNVVPSLLLPKGECSIRTLVQRFPDTLSYVLQLPNGAGGAGTWIVENESDCALARLSITSDAVASRYIPGVPLNQHIVVTDVGGLPLPPSVQIVEISADKQPLYRGADYAAASGFSAAVRANLDRHSTAIAEGLAQLGYRGVAGIDYILNGENLFLVEINPRFQASSPSLNASLVAAGQASLQHMHMAAFEQRPVARPDVDCHESFYIYSGRRLARFPPLPDGWNLEIEGGSDHLPAKIDPAAPTYRLSGKKALVESFHSLPEVARAVRELLATTSPPTRRGDGGTEDAPS